MASVNYSFDQRIFMDASFRMDGSTAFGRNKKYTNFWSAGLGWNLNRESFLASANWINTLRLRADIGTNGNQGFGTLTSVSTYTYGSYINLFGQGLDLTTLGNPNLRWQKTQQTNVGTDIVLFGNKLSFTGNAFIKITDPLIVSVPLPSSTGLSNYPLNTGKINTKGIDLSLKYSFIYKPQSRFVWSVGGTAGMYKSRYEGFNNTLAALNKLNQLNSYLERYTDGYSPTDQWAVRSLGIDPATGNEVFVKKNGQSTFTYDANDIVRIGNSQPTVQGVVSTNLYYKGFSVNVSLRYSLGAELLNSALYNKVENITYSSIANNQDKRALYDRWKKAGDIAKFKAISLVTINGVGATAMSSRFLQKENYLSGESMSIGYDFAGYKWIKLLHMDYFKVNAYANDIFKISTILRERGIDYPYANTISFSVSAGF